MILISMALLPLKSLTCIYLILKVLYKMHKKLYAEGNKRNLIKNKKANQKKHF
jgi:hypothetical protein